MANYEIPLSPKPQKFTIAIVGVTYQLTVKWCIPANCWILDIATQQGQAIINGIPLVTGVDLLEQYGYLNFGGSLYAQTDHAIDVPPTYSNLGTTGHLYFITT